MMFIKDWERPIRNVVLPTSGLFEGYLNESVIDRILQGTQRKSIIGNDKFRCINGVKVKTDTETVNFTASPAISDPVSSGPSGLIFDIDFFGFLSFCSF